MERTNTKGDPIESPPDYVAVDLPDGVVFDRTFVERTEPAAEHNEEQLEEDDDFLSVGSETWDYDIDESREDEFLAAMKNSQMAMDCERIDDNKRVAS